MIDRAPDATDTAQPTAWRVLAVLSTLLAFASISTDLYLPALPVMGAALHARAGMVEQTIAGYLIGFSVGQLFWGPIGDRYGRRRPVASGLLLFVIGSAGCALCHSVWTMIGWRVVQAVGACAGVVLARAMVRDLYAGFRAAQILSALMTVMAIAPLIGPLLGGQILALGGWQAIFWTLVAVGIMTLIALFALPETLPAERRNPQPLSRAIAACIALMGDRRLLAYAGTGGFFYAGTFAYIAGTPFAYIDYYGVSPQTYGWLFALGITGIMATNLLNARMVGRLGIDRLLRCGTLGAAAAGICLAITARTGWLGLTGLIAPLVVFLGATGFIVANSITGALARFPGRAGAVSALVGALQYGSGIIGSAAVGAFADGSPSSMAAVIALSGLGSAVCAWLLLPQPPHREPEMPGSSRQPATH